MASISSNYSVRIPKPDVAALEQLAQLDTQDGLLEVFWIRGTRQVVLVFGDEWYIQNDGYILDSVSEILGIKESVITVSNLKAGNRYDPSTFSYADAEMARQIYNCMWSDYTCDHMILQADLSYPYDCA